MFALHFICLNYWCGMLWMPPLPLWTVYLLSHSFVCYYLSHNTKYTRLHFLQCQQFVNCTLLQNNILLCIIMDWLVSKNPAYPSNLLLPITNSLGIFVTVQCLIPFIIKLNFHYSVMILVVLCSLEFCCFVYPCPIIILEICGHILLISNLAFKRIRIVAM